MLVYQGYKHTNHPQTVGLLDCPHEIHGFGHGSKPWYPGRPSPNDVFLDRGEITCSFDLICLDLDDQSTKFDIV